VLSKGVVSRASISGSGRGGTVATVVNGDPAYDARTTRRALALLVERCGLEFGRLELQQTVDVPIGCGFGASAASALSAVYAAASAWGLRAPKADIARCAYDAEIIEQTGLGTVSVTYDGAGAGAITQPGEPGVAKFVNVKVPASVRLVTASLAPYEKRDAFSSPDTAQKIVRLGDEALGRFVAGPTLEGLAALGEWFTDRLGLGSADVRRLAKVAKEAGALYASQNMMGQAVHAVTLEDSADRVVRALAAAGPEFQVDVFEVGSVKAGPF
jgi:pantoate kinase